MASFSIAQPEVNPLRHSEPQSRPATPRAHYWDGLIIAALQMGALTALAYASFVIKSLI